MTHKEAVRRLMALAGGRDCNLSYDTNIFTTGKSIVTIGAYIEGHDFVYGQTYHQVITGMEAKLGIGHQEPPEDDHIGEVNEMIEDVCKDLLSCCLFSPEKALPTAMKTLVPTDISDPFCRMVYRAMVDLTTEDEPVDLVTLSRKLGEKMKVPGTATKLAALVDRIPPRYEGAVDELVRKILKVHGEA